MSAAKLTAKQQRFVDEYLIDLNATAAYKRAGYAGNGNTAEVNAHKILRNGKVSAYIAEKKKERQANTGITAERTLKELAALVFSDVRKLFDASGALKPVADLDDATAACIASIEVDTLFDGSGKEREAVGTTTKIKMWDKNSAAEKLMRHLGMFKEDNKQKTDPVSDLVSFLQSRSQRLPITHEDE